MEFTTKSKKPIVEKLILLLAKRDIIFRSIDYTWGIWTLTVKKPFDTSWTSFQAFAPTQSLEAALDYFKDRE